jgi:hypothetical protein
MYVSVSVWTWSLVNHLYEKRAPSVLNYNQMAFFKMHLNDFIEPSDAKSIYNAKLSDAIEHWQAI